MNSFPRPYKPEALALLCAIYVTSGLYFLVEVVFDVVRYDGMGPSHLPTTVLAGCLGTFLLQTLRMRPTFVEGLLATWVVASAPLWADRWRMGGAPPWTVDGAVSYFAMEYLLPILALSIPIHLFLEYVRRPVQAPAYRAVGGVILAAATLGGITAHATLVQAPFLEGHGFLSVAFSVLIIPTAVASPSLGPAFLQLCSREKIEEFFPGSLFLILAPIAVYTWHADLPFAWILILAFIVTICSGLAFAAIVLGAVIGRSRKTWKTMAEEAALPLAISTQVAHAKHSCSNEDRADETHRPLPSDSERNQRQRQ